MGFRRNPLDLNNAPEDFPRDHDKQPLNHSFPSSSGSYRKKKNGGKDESRKVYECRFCSLTFCKSQALGGHMNRHRQERETETLNKARKLVFGNDNPIYQRGSQPIVHGGYHHQASCNMAGTVYPTRPFSGTSTPPPPPPPPPPDVFTPPPYWSLHHKSESEKDYFMGHVCTINPQFIFQKLSTSPTPPPDGTTNYTCIGAPIGQMFTGKSGGDRDISLPAINRSYHKDGF